MRRTTLILLLVLALAVGALLGAWQVENLMIPAESRARKLPFRVLLGETLSRAYGRPQHSWHLEESIIRDFFNDRRGGVFLDVGAGPAEVSNNTYYLEKHLGWSGIAIDAQQQYEADYLEHRPRTRFFPLFVSDVSDAEAVFFVPKNRRDASKSSGVRSWLGNREVAEVEVPTITLNDLLDRLEIPAIDFLNMDIELWEPRALAGFDIRRFRPELVCIEAHYTVRDELTRYFAENDYVRIEKYLPVDDYNWYFTPRSIRPGT